MGDNEDEMHGEWEEEMTCDEDYEYEYADDEDENLDGDPENHTASNLSASNIFEILLSDLPRDVIHYSELIRIYNTLREIILTCPYSVFYEWEYNDPKKFRLCNLTAYGPGKASRPYHFQLEFPTAPKSYPDNPPLLTPTTSLPALIFIGISNHPLLAAKTWNPCQNLNILFKNVMSLLETWEAYSRHTSICQGALHLPPSQNNAALEVLISTLTAIYLPQVRRLYPDLDQTLEVLETFDSDNVVKACDPVKSAKVKKLSGIGYSSTRESSRVSVVPDIISRDKPLVKTIYEKLDSIMKDQDNDEMQYSAVAFPWVLSSPLPELLLCMLNECSKEEVVREAAYIEHAFSLCHMLEQMQAICPTSLPDHYTEKRAAAVADVLREVYRHFLHYEGCQLLDNVTWIESLHTSPLLQSLRSNNNSQKLDSSSSSSPSTDNFPILKQRVFHCSGSEINHHYYSIGVAEKCPVKWLKELKYIEDNLPEEITLYVSEEHPNYIIANMFIANADCPYYGGAYVFHIMVPASYPQVNPKVHFMTTGEGVVRFNPNLYNCGKVCLSLLGTWEGERWNPKTSNMTQVLSSILFLIFTEQPYFNEPGYQATRGTTDGDRRSLLYDVDVFQSMVQYALQYHFNHLDFYPLPLQQVLKAYYKKNWEEKIKGCLIEKATGMYKGCKGDVLERLEQVSQRVASFPLSEGDLQNSGMESDGETSSESRKKAKQK